MARGRGKGGMGMRLLERDAAMDSAGVLFAGMYVSWREKVCRVTLRKTEILVRLLLFRNLFLFFTHLLFCATFRIAWM